MAFDAGAITAELSIRTDKANADLDKIEERVKKLTKPRTIRVSALFDTASLMKARKMFADLDNMISRDAAQRLKSSPQGSVLGALNSLFSPHPVTGAPSPQAAASQGLLGKMFAPEGGGSTPVGGGGGTSGGGAGPGNTSTTNLIRQVLTGQGAVNQDTIDRIKQELTGQGAQNQVTTDQIKQMLTGQGAVNQKTTDTITQMLTGKGATDTTTKDTVKEAIDPAAKAAVIKDAGDTGDKSGRSFSAFFSLHVGGMLASFRKNMASSGSGGGAAMGAGLLSGIGPGILGISGKMTAMIGGIGTVMAALPAVAGLAGVGMGVAMIGGLLAGVVASSPKLKAQLKGIGADAQSALKAIAAPVIPALSAAFAQIPPLLKSLTPALAGVMKTVAPQIAGVFAGLAPILRGLVGVMQAAAPAFGPFIRALEGLVSNILPGVQMVIKATIPFISQLAGILGKLGSNLGGLFAAAAPAIGASMKVLGALLGLIGGLLPIIMKLADVFASALAPAIIDIGSVIKSLMPILQIVGQVLAALAQAIIGDLVSAFGALATLLIGITPSLNILAKALEQVFAVLENTGVFAELGDALEAVAPPLANLINALVISLAPALPVLIAALSDMVTVFARLAAAGLAGIATALTVIVKAIPVPVLDAIAIGIVGVVTAMKAWAIVNAILVGSMQLLGVAAGLTTEQLAGLTIAEKLQAVWEGVVSIATKAWAVAQGILDAVMAANPIFLVVAAVVALGAAFYLAWEKSAGFRDAMKDIAGGMLQFGIVIVSGAKMITDAFLGMVGAIIDGAAAAFGWIPGLGGKLRGAAQAFDTWRAGVNSDFNSAITTMQNWQLALTASSTAAQAAMNAAASAIVTDLTNTGVSAGAAKTDVENYTTAVQQNGATSSSAQGARAQLISDLEKAGLSAQGAAALVATLTAALGRVPRNVPVTISADATGTGGITITGTGTASGAGGIRLTSNAAGGKITQGTGPTADDVLALVSKGETVVSAADSKKLAPVFKMLGVPGYAAGGIPGLDASAGQMAPYTSGQVVTDGIKAVAAGIQEAISKASAAVAAAGGAGPAGVAGGAVEALMKSMAAARGWTGALWNDLYAVEMAEAGFNLTAQNPGSGAYGLAQFINGPSEYAQYGGNVGTAAGQITAMLNYIQQRYGTPAAAWAHEQQYHWYGNGGVIPEPVTGFGHRTGQVYKFAEKSPEYVTPMKGAAGWGGGSSRMEALLERLIDVTGSLPHGITGGLGAALGGAAQSASFRSRYPRST
jgi:hypothetical protein